VLRRPKALDIPWRQDDSGRDTTCVGTAASGDVMDEANTAFVNHIHDSTDTMPPPPPPAPPPPGVCGSITRGADVVQEEASFLQHSLKKASHISSDTTLVAIS
jgi:hypothetical protein